MLNVWVLNQKGDDVRSPCLGSSSLLLTLGNRVAKLYGACRVAKLYGACRVAKLYAAWRPGGLYHFRDKTGYKTGYKAFRPDSSMTRDEYRVT